MNERGKQFLLFFCLKFNNISVHLTRHVDWDQFEVHSGNKKRILKDKNLIKLPSMRWKFKMMKNLNYRKWSGQPNPIKKHVIYGPKRYHELTCICMTIWLSHIMLYMIYVNVNIMLRNKFVWKCWLEIKYIMLYMKFINDVLHVTLYPSRRVGRVLPRFYLTLQWCDVVWESFL